MENARAAAADSPATRGGAAATERRRRTPCGGLGGRGPVSPEVCDPRGAAAPADARLLHRSMLYARKRRTLGPRHCSAEAFSRGKLYRMGHRRAAPAHAGVTLLKFVTHPSPRGAAVVRPSPVRGRGERGAPSGRFCRRSRPASVRPSVRPRRRCAAAATFPRGRGGATLTPPRSPLLSPRSCQVLPVPPVRPKEPPDWAPGRAHVTPSVTSSLPVSFSCVLK